MLICVPGVTTEPLPFSQPPRPGGLSDSPAPVIASPSPDGCAESFSGKRGIIDCVRLN